MYASVARDSAHAATAVRQLQLATTPKGTRTKKEALHSGLVQDPVVTAAKDDLIMLNHVIAGLSSAISSTANQSNGVPNLRFRTLLGSKTKVTVTGTSQQPTSTGAAQGDQLP